MAKIVTIGGGVVGLTAAALLADDGHEVLVLERDPSPPPPPAEAWEGWERRGVNQFRLLHYFQSRFRTILETELPEVLKAVTDAGALLLNVLEVVPADVSGGPRAGDDQLTCLTGRRTVIEAAVAGAVERMPGVTIRRGVGVTGLLAGATGDGGAPHVVGVRLDDDGEERADLVVDLSGRRSALPRWLDDIGARPVVEEHEDSGFAYYGRHFRSADGSTPPLMAPLVSPFGSVSVLTLPADNGTWGVGIITLGVDAELRGLRDNDRWMKAMTTFVLQAHWTEGEPIDDVAFMTKIEDRRRRFVVDGAPVATGVVAAGDAWACTNPSLGRGASIGAIHAVALRDHVRHGPLDQPAAFAGQWDTLTDDAVGEWYDVTRHYDRHRLAESSAALRGEDYEPHDEQWTLTHALQFGAGSDPDLFRGMLNLVNVVRPPSEIMAGPGVLDKLTAIGDGYKAEETFGPTRDDLVAIAQA